MQTRLPNGPKWPRLWRFLLLWLALGSGGCGSNANDFFNDLAMPGRIIGEEDWDELRSARDDPAYPAAYAQGRSVAWLRIDDSLGRRRCTGFVAGRGVLATASHCLRSLGGQRSETPPTLLAFFGKIMDAQGRIPAGDDPALTGYDCSEILREDIETDTLLLRCEPRGLAPPIHEAFAPLVGTAVEPAAGEHLYVLSVNDYDDPNARPPDWDPRNESSPVSVKISPGPSHDTAGDNATNRFDFCRIQEAESLFIVNSEPGIEGFSANCDQLPGSSGGPVFRKQTAEVLGVVSGFDLPGTNRFGGYWKLLRRLDDNGDGLLDPGELD